MRILLLTQFFDPEPHLKGLSFAKRLVELGHSVSVLTGFPNYPGGKVYPNYRIRLLQRECIDGVEIFRVPLYPSHNRSSVQRIFNYASFFLSSLIYGLFFLKKPDVIYAYHPPITTGVSAAIIGLFRRIPFVLDIQDLWPDTLIISGMVNSGILMKIIDSCCGWVYSRASKIVVLSQGFKDLLEKRGIFSQKIVKIYNWCDEKRIGEVKPKIKNSIFNVVFAGTMGVGQALEYVLDAADILRDAPGIKFQFVGDGTEVSRLKDIVLAKKLQNVEILPSVRMEEVSAVFNNADALLVHLKQEDLFKITIPSKTQAYLYVGRPVVMAVHGEASDIVAQANAGVCVMPENAEEIAKAVLQLSQLSDRELESLGFNGTKFYTEHMSFESGVNRFLKVFIEVTKDYALK
jgi:colanic acid biosynthesis glycosyl transferase WcaI